VNCDILLGEIVVIFGTAVIKEAQFSLEETHAQPGGTSAHGEITVIVGEGDRFGNGVLQRQCKKQLLVAGGTVHRPVLGRLERLQRKCLFPEFRVGEDGQKLRHIENVLIVVLFQQCKGILCGMPHVLFVDFDQLAAGVGIDAVDPEKQFDGFLFVAGQGKQKFET